MPQVVPQSWSVSVEGSREVSPAEARRIAVRTQLLDGSAKDVLSTVRKLGFLQIDPISVVAPPQHLVLWSRLGQFDRAELDRLLWKERKLVEWDAFIWPIEDLPLLRARMKARSKKYTWVRHREAWLKEHAGYRRFVLRDLERRGPLLGREIEDHARSGDSRWWGERRTTLMLEILSSRGEVAVVGRDSGQRRWDLAERWYPETETVPLESALRQMNEKRFGSLGVRLEKGRLVAHPDATDGPVASRVTFLSPFDRLIHDRNRAHALWDFFYRLEMYVPKAKREYGYYVLPILRGDRIIGRIEPAYDRKSGLLEVNGVFAEPGAPAGAGPGIARTMRNLGKWLGATDIKYSRRVPAIWRDSLRN
ncbi:MAG: crosslink repair DNA glycosylase YcaQ family protein [Actinomycetota bacterium]